MRENYNNSHAPLPGIDFLWRYNEYLMNVKMEEHSAVNNDQLQVDRCLLSIGPKDWRPVSFTSEFLHICEFLERVM